VPRLQNREFCRNSAKTGAFSSHRKKPTGFTIHDFKFLREILRGLVIFFKSRPFATYKFKFRENCTNWPTWPNSCRRPFLRCSATEPLLISGSEGGKSGQSARKLVARRRRLARQKGCWMLNPVGFGAIFAGGTGRLVRGESRARSADYRWFRGNFRRYWQIRGYALFFKYDRNSVI
jgi:hypothetical protein